MSPVEKALNRLCHWRTILTGWQLGTRAKGDPEGDAVRDHREVTLLMRTELNALVRMLVGQGIIDIREWEKELTEQADYLSKRFEQKFPGIKATDAGLDIDVKKAAETMKGWKP